jgi:hypothetical protein
MSHVSTPALVRVRRPLRSWNVGRLTQRAIAGLLLSVGAALSLSAQDRAPLEVAPLFTNVGFGPAFMLTCVNDATAPLHVHGVGQDISLRVDGKLIQRTGGGYSGGDPIVQPGGSFHVMFLLRQPGPAFWTMSAEFGALLRTGQTAPLEPGAHAVEFQCLARTSRPIQMYWENAPVPK